MNSRDFWFIALPSVANALLVLGAYYLRAGFENQAVACFVVATCSAMGSISAVGALAAHRIGRAGAIVALGLHAVLLISVFAVIYHGFGLGVPRVAVDFSDAVYFSIVTWTTLGYGDFQPPQQLRILAALEAALGYVFLGLLVGLLGGMLSTSRRD